ncbi:MAG: hypothetical protein ACXWSC_11365, partial [Bdellovibrionota bacterium]
NIRAIMAFCEPAGVDPEVMFTGAEIEDPTGDLILVLHAKYVWKHDRERAKPLWEKVMKLARNSSLVSMAERYLSDEVETDEILHLSTFSYLLKLQLGGGYESNPTLPLAPNPNIKRPQGFSDLRLQGGAQRWYPFGSVSVNYEGGYDRYLATPELSLFANQVEFPVSLRLGTYEDLVLRPFYGISLAGPRHFGSRYGGGIMGVAYRTDYKQSVQGSIFSERLLFPQFKPEEGTHFRFDYDWEFFPDLWIYRFQASMEHVRAVNDFNNGTNLKFSHTDIGTGFQVKRLFHGIAFEAAWRATMRLDSLQSSYDSPTLGLVRYRRNDLTLALRPAVSLPVADDLAVRVSYEIQNTFSPTGPDDYADYNRLDQTAEVLFTTEFSNY